MLSPSVTCLTKGQPGTPKGLSSHRQAAAKPQGQEGQPASGVVAGGGVESGAGGVRGGVGRGGGGWGGVGTDRLLDAIALGPKHLDTLNPEPY